MQVAEIVIPKHKMTKAEIEEAYTYQSYRIRKGACVKEINIPLYSSIIDNDMESLKTRISDIKKQIEKTTEKRDKARADNKPEVVMATLDTLDALGEDLEKAQKERRDARKDHNKAPDLKESRAWVRANERELVIGACSFLGKPLEQAEITDDDRAEIEEYQLAKQASRKANLFHGIVINL